MTQQVETWVQQTQKIYKGVLLYSVAGVLYAILDPINSLSNAVGHLSSFADRGTFDMSVSALDVICYLLIAGIIGGYILFLQGLGGFTAILKGSDQIAMGRVRTGVILALIGSALGFIPFLGWIGGILNIISFIMMMLGYSALKNSATFPEESRKGASKLYTAMILSIIGAVLGFIPVAGGFIEMVFDIIAFFMILSGWASIKNTVPTEESLQ